MVMMRLAIVTAVVAGLSVPAPARAQSKAERNIERVLLARNESIRNALLKAWLTPPGSPKPDLVRQLSVDLLVSEARLQAMGVDRPAIADQVSVSEIPMEVLSQRTGLALGDLFRFLRGKSFVVPAAPAYPQIASP